MAPFSAFFANLSTTFNTVVILCCGKYFLKTIILSNSPTEGSVISG